MSLNKRAALFNSTIRYVSILGVCLYLVSFLLPACDTTGHSGAPFRGWDCAWMVFDMAYVMVVGIRDPTTRGSLVVALFSFISGCINLMVPAYLWLSFTMRSRKVRRWLGAALILSIAATWADFLLLGLIPLIGHFVWIAGVSLILTRELSNPQADDGNAPAS